MGRGVSACATCDGFFYKGQDVVVVGGGNTAVEEALYLSNIARTVTVVHRRDKFRAEAILVDKLMAKTRDGGNMRIAVEPRARRGARRRAPASTACASRDAGVGTCAGARACTACSSRSATRPTRRSSRASSTMAGGYIKVHGGADGNATATSVRGVFAAGDVADHVYRQAVTSAGTGCMAALDAEAFLDDHPIAVPLETAGAGVD